MIYVQWYLFWLNFGNKRSLIWNRIDFYVFKKIRSKSQPIRRCENQCLRPFVTKMLQPGAAGLKNWWQIIDLRSMGLLAFKTAIFYHYVRHRKKQNDHWNCAESESAARWLGFWAWEYSLGFLAGRCDVLWALIGCASPHGSNDAPRIENFHTARSNQK